MSGSIPVRCSQRAPRGFSLVEILVVIAITGILLGVGVGIFGKTANTHQKATVDQFSALVEQARTSAITRRKPVLLAVAPPSSTDNHYRLGLFEVDELPEPGTNLAATQLGRWTELPAGIAFLKGNVQALRNLADQPTFELSWRNGRYRANVYAFAFNPRGGLSWPTGSDPVAVTIGTGVYQNGSVIPTNESGRTNLRVGRIVARPWRFDS